MAELDLGKIMIIEDNEQDYNMLVRAFKEVGIENPVVYHNNGDTALEHLQEKKSEMPEYIFLDLNMPGIDGRDVLRKIKGHDRLSKITIIVMTSSNKKSDIEDCYDNGADNYIMKPMGFEGYINEAKMIRSFITNPEMRL
jgi:two-component system response regulator